MGVTRKYAKIFIYFIAVKGKVYENARAAIFTLLVANERYCCMCIKYFFLLVFMLVWE